MEDRGGASPIAALRWPAAAVLAAAFVLPFLFVTVPPLTDVPGHIGRFAVQTAPAGDPVLRLFDFRWALTLNLASDVLVQALHPLVGVVPATWFLCAATPVLTAVALIAIARVLNPRGAYSLPWALIFVINFPYLWGFLNFALTAALALLAFTSWIALATRPRVRVVESLVVTPTLLIGHGVAGVLGIGLILAHALSGRRGPRRPPRRGGRR